MYIYVFVTLSGGLRMSKNQCLIAAEVHVSIPLPPPSVSVYVENITDLDFFHCPQICKLIIIDYF
jgi:hypothetical protein